jgi:single-stranded-DNA-specific exonuclease
MQNNNSQKESPRLGDGTIIDPLIAKILAQRNVNGQESIRKFLHPKLQELPSPHLMKDMELAVTIIGDAVKRGVPILIFGDYDVDGTTATALLILFFQGIGCKADYYIPNRLSEGYGLQEKSLRKLSMGSEHTEKVLITVDNGISAHEAVQVAGELGYRTIITDHHTPPSLRVSADAVLNPKQTGCSFPDKNLAGVGVAFYLAMGVRSHLTRSGYFSSQQKAPNLKVLLDLVAIGTVADMVPLSGINRTLVKAGLETLALTLNYGLTELCRQTNLDCSYIRSEDISFQLAPKINAAGRLGQADKAIGLFLAKSKKEAREIAGDLVRNNDIRKNININDFDKAQDEVDSSSYGCPNSTIVAGTYHIGVAGIVASNLVEKYHKPSVVLCNQDECVLRGSARSVPGVDLYGALEDCKDVLLGFGGHSMAGGMSLLQSNLENFRKRFDEAVYRQNKGVIAEREHFVDADIQIADLFSRTILFQMHLLEPFGQGNPQPIFRDTVTRLKEITPIGKDKAHLRLSFYNGRTTIKGIAFGLGKLAGKCRSSKAREIHYTPSINFFRGKRSWQARVTKIEFDS